jgi:hypothetical protein
MDRDDVAFPDPNELAPHAIAFARMMFAHAGFEREVRSLVDAINPKEPGFGERFENQWRVSRSSTANIMVLIMRHCGSSRPEIEQIRAELYKVRRSLEPKMMRLTCVQHLASCMRPSKQVTPIKAIESDAAGSC